MSQVDTLDEIKLANYLEQQVEGFKGPLTATKFAGGQSNPTFKIDAASGTYVLRRQPPGKLLKSAHAVDREFRVLDALKDTDVPVAKVYHLCEDRDVIGSMFYLMEFCDGNIFWGAALPEIDSNEQRARMYDEMNRVLAALHSVDIEAVGLSDYGKPGNYFERQLGRWTSQYRASELQPIAEMDQLIHWLEEHLPEDDGKVSLSHGDYRLDNVMFDKGNDKIIAVLDWELSTLGHPYADLAYQCMQLRLPASDAKNTMSGLLGVDPTPLGIPTEAQYVAKYCERMGIEKIDNWSFYLCFSFFRLGAIAQGVAKRAADGNASNKAAGKVGAMVRPLAQLALAIIDEQ
ncbi:phosphotransferase family protein [Pseudomaricurvus alkylphenolicus]|uniref:phosphotransferase family protein n=1 Tax=Pseudomaricurvus alkylphenolicus TaxID=1306991 RepID=UPI001420C2BC|nr:phosphotransferase family protein [Pseudomaricurvus alkylphenolicus]NIB44930.1 phosphotransferase family protein [Pseudomaricurvus alkylphenolicus]